MKTHFSIDKKGFDNMLHFLHQYTSAEFKDVVRAVTKDTLRLTAERTKRSNMTKITKKTKQRLRLPFKSSMSKYYMGANGNLWVSPYGRKEEWSWVLVKEGVKTPPENTPAEMPIYKGSKSYKKRKLKRGERQRINTIVRKARKYYQDKLKYSKRTIGLSQASWLHLGKLLNLRITGGKGLEFARRCKIPSSARSELYANEKGKKTQYNITIFNGVQASLNKKAGGMHKFMQSINGKAKEFQRAFAIDAKGFARKFATRNGFKVK